MTAVLVLVWALLILLGLAFIRGAHVVSYSKADEAADDAEQAKWIAEWAARNRKWGGGKPQVR